MHGIDTKNVNIQKDVIPVMQFHDKLIKGEDVVERKPLPTARNYTLRELVSNDDPKTLYKNLEKVDEGYFALFPSSIFRTNFIEIKYGKRSMGKVYKATAANGDKVAIKKVELNAENLKHIITEISILKESKHENVVQYIDSYVVNEKLWLVMEYMGAGCLADLLAEHEQVDIKESHIAYVCHQALKALQYVHSNGRIHRDVKSDNFLVNEKGYIKICLQFPPSLFFHFQRTSTLQLILAMPLN